jgi:hypothetical protein
MRKTKYALSLLSQNRCVRPALVVPVILSSIALVLLTGDFRPTFHGVNPGSQHFQVGPKEAVGGLLARLRGKTIPTPGKVGEQFAVSRLRFEENRGEAVKDVRFLAHANGSLLFLTRTAAVLMLPPTRNLESALKLGLPARPADRTGAGTRAALRMELANANPNSRTLCSELLPGESNYFLRNNPTHWITHIPNCARVRYEQVYPGIDLVYYGNHQQLEYDYILAAGADPHQVRLRLSGPRSIRLSTSGDLIMDVKGSQFLLRKPQAYQTGKNGKEWVRAGYALHGANLVGLIPLTWAAAAAIGGRRSRWILPATSIW